MIYVPYPVKPWIHNKPFGPKNTEKKSADKKPVRRIYFE